ncbi:MAG: hypothetical protein V9G12_20525 [Microthrixaceae bacterium]
MRARSTSSRATTASAARPSGVASAEKSPAAVAADRDSASIPAASHRRLAVVEAAPSATSSSRPTPRQMAVDQVRVRLGGGRSSGAPTSPVASS